MRGPATTDTPSLDLHGVSMSLLTLKKARAALRAYALAFPGAAEEFPWGHTAIKVHGKAFLFIGGEDQELSLSTKLPSSCDVALALPFARPTGYGLGKSGWVSASFGAKDRVPVPVLRMWIEESYRAIAPKVRRTAAPMRALKPSASSRSRRKKTPRVKGT